MLMFVYLFGGAIHTGTRYVDYVVPGVLFVCVAFGAATTAVSVAHDLTSGIIDRFRSMDVRGEALINGHVLASVARNMLSTTVVFAVALAIGFQPTRRPGQLDRRDRRHRPVHARAVLVRGRDRNPHPLTRGGTRNHVPDQLPGLPEQRIRTHPHDANLAARLRVQPARDRCR